VEIEDLELPPDEFALKFLASCWAQTYPIIKKRLPEKDIGADVD